MKAGADDAAHARFAAIDWTRPWLAPIAMRVRPRRSMRSASAGSTRGGVRDALTLFDENAVLFACADPALADALRVFDWRALFVDARDAWGTRCEARIFGHALLEKLVVPYKACTGHA